MFYKNLRFYLKDEVAGICILFEGSANDVVLDTKLVLAAALQCGASSMIIVCY